MQKKCNQNKGLDDIFLLAISLAWLVLVAGPATAADLTRIWRYSAIQF